MVASHQHNDVRAWSNPQTHFWRKARIFTHKRVHSIYKANPSKTMKQRTSTRQVKVSKAFQVVDEATRKANQDYRLLSLELDNYNEREMLGMGGADEDNYQESDVR